MKNVFTSGMILFLAMTTMVSCTQENVMLETTPQVKNQEVRFCFFESSIVPIGQDEESNLARTRADGSERNRSRMHSSTQNWRYASFQKGTIPLPATPQDRKARKTDFGNVSLNVPPGEYTLVAAPINTNMELEEPIEHQKQKRNDFCQQYRARYGILLSGYQGGIG